MAQEDDEDGVVFAEEVDDKDKGKLMLLESLGNLGYESHYMAVTMGSIYIFMLVTVVGFILMPFTTLLRRLHPRIAKFDHQLKAFFLWNWCIRLILEAALELSFTCMLNWYFLGNIANPKTTFEMIDYSITIIVTISLIALPFFIAIFYNVYWAKVEEGDEEFEEKFGAVYDGLKTDSRWILFHSINFMLRRALLSYTCLFLSNSLWL